MTADHRGPRIDVSRLPEDVVRFVDALGPGENLLLTRDGVPVATITGVPGRPDEEAADGPVTVVATAMKLSPAARSSLSAELGTGYVVLDLPQAPATADVLLIPPSSPQLIGALRSSFPKARVIITEFEDRHLGVSYHGPIRRMLDAGAETYLSSTTVPRLAEQLGHTITRGRQLAGGTTRLEIEPPHDEDPR